MNLLHGRQFRVNHPEEFPEAHALGGLVADIELAHERRYSEPMESHHCVPLSHLTAISGPRWTRVIAYARTRKSDRLAGRQRRLGHGNQPWGG